MYRNTASGDADIADLRLGIDAMRRRMDRLALDVSEATAQTSPSCAHRLWKWTGDSVDRLEGKTTN